MYNGYSIRDFVRIYSVILMILGGIVLAIAGIIALAIAGTMLRMSPKDEWWLLFVVFLAMALIVAGWGAYYLCSGIKMYRGKFTKKKMIIHNSIIFMLTILQILLAVHLINYPLEWPVLETPAVGVALMLFGLILAIMALGTIVVTVRNRWKG